MTKIAHLSELKKQAAEEKNKKSKKDKNTEIVTGVGAGLGAASAVDTIKDKTFLHPKIRKSILNVQAKMANPPLKVDTFEKGVRYGSSKGRGLNKMVKLNLPYNKRMKALSVGVGALAGAGGAYMGSKLLNKTKDKK